MKRFSRILARMVLVLLMLLVTIWLLIQTPFIQDWLGKTAAKRLSKSLDTKVSIDHVSLRLLNSFNLEGVYVEDRNKDTLLFAGLMRVNITDWFLTKDSADLKYLKLKDVTVNLYRKDSVWNYQFLVDFFSSDSKKESSGGITLHLKTVDLQNIHIKQSDRWRGRYLVAGVGKLHLEANQVNLNKGLFDIEDVVVEKPEYREYKRPGLWQVSDSIAYWKIRDSLALADTSPKRIGPAGMLVKVNSIKVRDGSLEFYNKQRVASVEGLFDERDIVINQLSGNIKQLRMTGDTLTALAELAATERSGIVLKRVSTRFRLTPYLMEFADLDLQMNESRVGDYYAMRYNSLDDMEDFINKVKIEANIQNSTVSIKDIGFFASLLKTKNQLVKVQGKARGTVSNFSVDGLDLRTGNSRITGTYKMAGLIDIKKTIINFQTNGSQVALEDVAVWAPEVRLLRNTPVAQLGTITYRGNYSGTVYDFKTIGTVETAVGSMGADFRLKMDGPGKGYSGIISNAKFQGGKLFGVPQLGTIEFEGTIGSNGFGIANPLKINGTLLSADYVGYTYHNIMASAVFSNNRLTADLLVNDSNLAGSFETVLDFNENRQRFNGRGILVTADLRALGFIKDSLRFSGEFDVDFKGKTIDDFLGYARFYNTSIEAAKGPLSFDSLLLQSDMDTLGNKKLTLHTNEADATVEGKFNLSDLGNAFQYFLNRYYPAIIKPPKRVVKNQDFYFNINTRQVEPFLALVDKKLHGFNYAKLTGSLNTSKNELLINTDVPSFAYENLRFTNAMLKGSGNAESLIMMGSIENLAINDSINFPNAVLKLNTNQDTTHVLVNTSTTGPLGEAKIDAFIYSKEDGFETRFNESSFIVNNKKWTIHSDGNLAVSNGYLTSAGISLQQDMQSINMFTQPSDEGNWNDIHMNIKNLNAGDLLPYFLTEPRMEGLASGKVLISNPMGAMHVTSNLVVNQFRFNNDSIGVVTIEGEYTGRTKKMVASVQSLNEAYDFTGKIQLDLNDSAENQINAVVPVKNMRVNVLKKYLNVIFDEVDGFANGNLQVVGKLKNPAILGEVTLRNGVFKVGYTQCVYKIDDAVLLFGENYIDFGKMEISDEMDRKGYVEGRFYHRFFENMSFNLKLRTDGMLVLNTSGKDNELFYGKAVAKGTFDLTGPLYNMNMRLTGTPTDSSHIYISNKTTRETGNADFVVFKSYGTEMQVVLDPEKTNYHMDIDLNANPLCKVDVILDEITGDVIKAVGNGNIKIHTGTVDETTMRGRYVIETGSYNYSFQTLIRKPFDLLGEDDNYIEWTGDPYDANLNINAKYLARKVSMSTLVGGSGANTPLDQNARNAQGDISVIAKIKGRLSNPQIDFDIEFAPGSALRNNLSAQDMLRRIREDNTEKLRQVTYLIVFKTFAPYKEGSSLRNPGTDLAVNTISEIVSREMGKILTSVVHQITGDQSLNVDISTNFYNSSQTLTGTTTSSAVYDRVNLGFNLNRSYFNNRIVVNIGSDFDLSVRNTTASGFQFLPDISVEFILTSNRRLRAILFKRDNLDIGGRRNRAGASLSYRKDFEKLIGKYSEDVLFVIENDQKN